jgi:hypothetical protein
MQYVERILCERQAPVPLAQPLSALARCLRHQHQVALDHAKHTDQPLQPIRPQPAQVAQPEPRDPIPPFAVPMHFLRRHSLPVQLRHPPQLLDRQVGHQAPFLHLQRLGVQNRTHGQV